MWSKYKEASIIPEMEQERRNITNKDKTSTFVDNMQLPIHRWFRYSAGFSAEWVKDVVRDFKGNNAIKLLDPFVGSGTTVLAGEECRIESFGIETHPFVARVANAKLLWCDDILACRLDYAAALAEEQQVKEKQKRKVLRDKNARRKTERRFRRFNRTSGNFEKMGSEK